jgi:hypothetical protein
MPKRFIESAHPAVGPEIAAPERVTKAKKPSLAEAARQVPEPARSNLDDLMLEMMSLEDRMRSPGFSKQDKIFYDILKRQMDERAKAVENITDPDEKKYEKARLAQARGRADIILHGKKEEEEKAIAQKARKAKISDVVSRGMKELEAEEEPVALETGRVAVSGEEEKPGYSMDKIIELGESLDFIDKTFEEEDRSQTAEQYAKESAAKGKKSKKEAEKVIFGGLSPEESEWLAGGKKEVAKVKRAESPEDFSDLEKMPSQAERAVESRRPLAEIEIENNTEAVRGRLLERYGLTDNQKYDAKLYLQQEINKAFEAKTEYKAAKENLILAYRQLKQFDNVPDEELLVRKIGMFEFRFGDGRKVRKNFEALQKLENDQKKSELRNFFDEEARSLLNAGYDIRRGNDALGAKVGRVVRATGAGMKRGTVFPGKA